MKAAYLFKQIRSLSAVELELVQGYTHLIGPVLCATPLLQISKIALFFFSTTNENALFCYFINTILSQIRL